MKRSEIDLDFFDSVYSSDVNISGYDPYDKILVPFDTQTKVLVVLGKYMQYAVNTQLNVVSPREKTRNSSSQRIGWVSFHPNEWHSLHLDPDKKTLYYDSSISPHRCVIRHSHNYYHMISGKSFAALATQNNLCIPLLSALSVDFIIQRCDSIFFFHHDQHVFDLNLQKFFFYLQAVRNLHIDVQDKQIIESMFRHQNPYDVMKQINAYNILHPIQHNHKFAFVSFEEDHDLWNQIIQTNNHQLLMTFPKRSPMRRIDLYVLCLKISLGYLLELPRELHGCIEHLLQSCHLKRQPKQPPHEQLVVKLDTQKSKLWESVVLPGIKEEQVRFRVKALTDFLLYQKPSLEHKMRVLLRKIAARVLLHNETGISSVDEKELCDFIIPGLVSYTDVIKSTFSSIYLQRLTKEIISSCSQFLYPLLSNRYENIFYSPQGWKTAEGFMLRLPTYIQTITHGIYMYHHQTSLGSVQLSVYDPVQDITYTVLSPCITSVLPSTGAQITISRDYISFPKSIMVHSHLKPHIKQDSSHDHLILLPLNVFSPDTKLDISSECIVTDILGNELILNKRIYQDLYTQECSLVRLLQRVQWKWL